MDWELFEDYLREDVAEHFNKMQRLFENESSSFYYCPGDVYWKSEKENNRYEWDDTYLFIQSLGVKKVTD